MPASDWSASSYPPLDNAATVAIEIRREIIRACALADETGLPIETEDNLLLSALTEALAMCGDLIDVNAPTATERRKDVVMLGCQIMRRQRRKDSTFNLLRRLGMEGAA